MAARTPPTCPSCGRPVADEAPLCPYCGETMPRAAALGRLAPWHFFAAVLAVATALAAAFGFPADMQSLAASVHEAFGVPSGRWPDALPAILRGLAALAVFLPLARRTAGVPSPPSAGGVAGGLAGRLLLLADGAAGAALCRAESTPQLIFGLSMLLICAAASRAFSLGFSPVVALALLAGAQAMA